MAVQGCLKGIRIACLLAVLATPVVATPGGCTIGIELETIRNSDLPERPTQGPICGINSCCGSVENKLKQTSRSDVERYVRDVVSHVVSLFDTRARRLEDLFKEMMVRSKKELHIMFEHTYGTIYLQNADVFTDFFGELEKYYLQGGIRLAETMDHFFTILYQRMFRVLNSQYDFDEEYLSCVARDMAKLKPFGDIPTKLGHMLKRSFAATRIFHKALGKGAQLAERTLKLNVSDICGEEITRMQYCNHCTNQKGAGTCTPYCTDTLKECLQHFIALNENWDSYIDALDKVADKLLGPFNIEMVVEPINVKISEAIMTFQDSGSEVSQRVFVECGAPKLQGARRRRSPQPGERQDGEIILQRLNFQGGGAGNGSGNSKKKHKKTNEHESLSVMDKRITEVKQKIKETKNFWAHLPYQYCNNITTASPSEDGNCWNGSAVSTYTSVEIPPKQYQPSIVSEQQYTLKVLVNKLESAFQGNDEDIEDDEEEESIVSSGSGSGAGESDEDTEEEHETTTLRAATTEDDIYRRIDEDHNRPKVVAASASDLTKAMFHYVVPIVMVWFGGAVTELL